METTPLTHFFTYRTDIPEGLGFAHFSAKHLLFLAGIIAFIVVITIIYKRLGEAGRRRTRIALATAIVLMEVIKQIICAVTGFYEWGMLPLHLCGMSIFVIAIHTVKKTRFTSEFLYSLSIPGAVMALVFADWNMYPLWNMYCLQSFLIHMCELAFPVMLLAAGDIRPRAKNLWMPAIYLAVVVPPIFFLNKRLDTNFLFLNDPAPGSPLSFLETFLGNPGYVFGTIGILIIVWLIMYAPVEILNHRKRH
jgi:hypothetical integral membrane protein (TIGR02206 family)